jgi:hypothetical protein
MRVTQVASANAVQPTQSSEAARTSRAKAAFVQASAAPTSEQPQQQPQSRNQQQSPVLNQNAISVEELSAIQTPGQVDNTEDNQQDTASTPEPKAEDPALSRQFAQLARQEKALRAKAQQQEQAIRAREEAIKAKEEQLTAKDNEYRQGYYSKDQIKQNYLQVLVDAGVPIEDAVQQLVSTSQTPQDPRVTNTISRLEAKIKALEEQNTTNQKTAAEQQTAAYQAAVNQIKTDAKKLVYTDPAFETIKATNSVNDVVELITETYNKDGVLLTVEEAAEQVENYLIDEAMKLTNIGKIKQRMAKAGATASTNAPGKTPLSKTQPQMKTLTNATSSTRQLSARDRALLAFKGELKS